MNTDLNILFNCKREKNTAVQLPEGQVFNQKVVIESNNLTVYGNGSEIVCGDNNSMVPFFGTADSATLTVKGSNIRFVNTVFANSFDYTANLKKRSEDASYTMGLQAVAVYLHEDADNIVFENCTFKGWQDTLFVDCRSACFYNCTIEGNIDFIFGRAYAYFFRCRIISRTAGYVTAPSTMADRKRGFVFEDCNFECKSGVEDESVYLARPWHPGGKQGGKFLCLFQKMQIWKTYKQKALDFNERFKRYCS